MADIQLRKIMFLINLIKAFILYKVMIYKRYELFDRKKSLNFSKLLLRL